MPHSSICLKWSIHCCIPMEGHFPHHASMRWLLVEVPYTNVVAAFGLKSLLHLRKILCMATILIFSVPRSAHTMWQTLHFCDAISKVFAYNEGIFDRPDSSHMFSRKSVDASMYRYAEWFQFVPTINMIQLVGTFRPVAWYLSTSSVCLSNASEFVSTHRMDQYVSTIISHFLY